jgi:hypothetical protein
VVAADRADGVVLAPAVCVLAATAERPASADHVGGLPITVIDLSFSGACTAGRLVAKGLRRQFAHAAAVAAPSLEWPLGLTVITAAPETYDDLGLDIWPLP